MSHSVTNLEECVSRRRGVETRRSGLECQAHALQTRSPGVHEILRVSPPTVCAARRVFLSRQKLLSF